MTLVHLLWLAGALFFCLWTALLARLKGYSALCWLLAAGPVGVLVLSRLPSIGSTEARARRRGNCLGLALSALLLLALCLGERVVRARTPLGGNAFNAPCGDASRRV